MNAITKEIFLHATTCMTWGWYLRSGTTVSSPSEGDQFRMAQGSEVGRMARSLFPEGILINPTNTTAAAEETARHISTPGTTTIFEATFQHDGYVAKADVLRRCGSSWEIIEVKSSLEDSERLDALIDDLTYTAMVAERSGTKIIRAQLMLISRSYRHGMDPSKFLVLIDQTEAVMERLRTFRTSCDKVRDGTAGICPAPKLLPICKACDFFSTHCLGKDVDDHILMLPKLHKNKLAQLIDQAIHRICLIPDDFPLTDTQQRVVQCMKTKQPFVSSTLRACLEDVVWPCHYLDFETVMTALPLYPDIPPYEQITTQYSIHHCSTPGTIIGHSDYLADPNRDCQEDLAARLLMDLGTTGTIVVYSSFEKTRITAMANKFPAHKAALLALLPRTCDLLQIIREGYYHHGFGGSFSIKSVLPTIVPEMSYANLGIGDGDTAVARFAKMAMGQYSSDQSAKVRQDLLTYCKQDTLAMVRLHEQLLARATQVT